VGAEVGAAADAAAGAAAGEGSAGVDTGGDGDAQPASHSKATAEASTMSADRGRPGAKERGLRIA
jgi:hypothetical protein